MLRIRRETIRLETGEVTSKGGWKKIATNARIALPYTSEFLFLAPQAALEPSEK